MPANSPYPGESATQFAARTRALQAQPAPGPVQRTPSAQQITQLNRSVTQAKDNFNYQQPLPQQPNNVYAMSQDVFTKQQAYAKAQQAAKNGQPTPQPAPSPTPSNQNTLTPEQREAQQQVTPPEGRTPGEQREAAMSPTQQGVAVVSDVAPMAVSEGGGLLTAEAGGVAAESVGMSTTEAGGAVLVDSSGNAVGTAMEQAGTEAVATQGWGAAAANILGAAAAIYAGYQMYDNYGERKPVAGAAYGATMGYYVAGPYGAVVGAAVGGLIGNVKAGKHEDQVNRDRFRQGLQELQITDEDHHVQFSDGSVFDMGKDGGNRLNNIDGSTRRFYEMDQKHPFSHQAVGWTNPLAIILAGGNVKLTNDFAAYFSNAVLTGAESLEEVRLKVIELYQKANISPEQFGMAINDLQKKGLITQDEAAALMAGAASVFTPNSGIEMSIEEFLAHAPPTGVEATQSPGAFTPDSYENPEKIDPVEPEPVPEDKKKKRGRGGAEGPATSPDVEVPA